MCRLESANISPSSKWKNQIKESQLIDGINDEWPTTHTLKLNQEHAVIIQRILQSFTNNTFPSVSAIVKNIKVNENQMNFPHTDAQWMGR